MRLLYLDDSGKIHPNDPAKVVVFGGFSIDESCWHRTVRQICGAKAAFFPEKGSGNPHSWEIKSSNFLTRNAWKRSRRRKFCDELVNILRRNNCTVYAVIVNKSKISGNPCEAIHVPLAFQRLIAKFHDELRSCSTRGMVVCDWSTHQLDSLITSCVSSLVASRNMQEVFGGVCYGDSFALAPLQIADLIARTFRMPEEGQHHVTDFAKALEKLGRKIPGKIDVLGWPMESIFRLF